MYSTDPFSSLLGFIAFMMLIAVLAAIIAPSRTYRYRKDLTNLYVAAKVRVLAKEDSIDLDEEYNKFRQYTKKRIADTSGIDNSIELEMQDKIINNNDTKEKKK